MSVERKIPTEAVCASFQQLLNSYASLSPDDLLLVRRSLADFQVHASGTNVKPLRGSGVRVVLSGWIGRTAELHDGRRQILSLALPGDLLEAVDLGDFDMGWMALGAARTADASALAHASTSGDHAALGQALARVRDATAERAVRHCLRLGRLSAYERAASLIVELHDRLSRAGVAHETAMPWPLTQEALSDVLGLSAVHTNRVLQELRRQRLIATAGGKLVLSDPEALRAQASA